jgi:hypothetical protein
MLERVARQVGLVDATGQIDDLLVSRLRGKTEADLVADATALRTRLSGGAATNPAKTQTVPSFDPTQPPRLSDPSLWKR